MGYIYMPQAAPPRGRQDPRAFDRSVLARHPAAAGRQGAVRRPAFRRNGGVGARSLRRRLHAAGDADREVGRRRGPHQGVRGNCPRRRHRSKPVLPESFNVLVKEMRSLGLNVELHNSSSGQRTRPQRQPSKSIAYAGAIQPLLRTSGRWPGPARPSESAKSFDGGRPRPVNRRR